eukprot:3270850-Rhodomonas_salina.2
MCTKWLCGISKGVQEREEGVQRLREAENDLAASMTARPGAQSAKPGEEYAKAVAYSLDTLSFSMMSDVIPRALLLSPSFFLPHHRASPSQFLCMTPGAGDRDDGVGDVLPDGRAGVAVA